MPVHILVIQETRALNQDLLQLLKAEGYQAYTTNPQQARNRLCMAPPDLAILSVRKLDSKTRPLCQELCQQVKSLAVPLMLLIESCDEAGLPPEPNACLVAPLSAGQLARVIETLLQNNEVRILAAGGLRLHLDTHQVYRCEESYYLSPKEFQLLETFLRHPAQVLTRRFLMREVWETDFIEDTRTLDVHVHWVRKKIEHDPSRPRYLKTVRGVGYRFVPDPPEP